ncbi:MAG: hypothetical protein N2C14_30600, partial [Planctomycetales bacterium]
ARLTTWRPARRRACLATPCIVLDEPADAVKVKHHFHDPDAEIVLEIVLEMFAASKDAGRGRLLALAR